MDLSFVRKHWSFVVLVLVGFISVYSSYAHSSSACERLFEQRSLEGDGAATLESIVNSAFRTESDLFKLEPLKREAEHSDREKTALDLYSLFPEKYKNSEEFMFRGIPLHTAELINVVKNGLDPMAGYATPGKVYFGEEPVIAIQYSIFHYAREALIMEHYDRDLGVPALVVMKRNKEKFVRTGHNFGEAYIYSTAELVKSSEFVDILILKPVGDGVEYTSLKDFLPEPEKTSLKSWFKKIIRKKD